MHEKDFVLLEGRSITLPELGREIESITGREIKDSTGEIKRVIAHLPNFESDTDTFVATYKLNHKNDFMQYFPGNYCTIVLQIVIMGIINVMNIKSFKK